MKTVEEAVGLCKYVYSQMPFVTKYDWCAFEIYVNSVFLTNEGYEDYFIKVFDEASEKGVGLYKYSEVLKDE